MQTHTIEHRLHTLSITRVGNEGACCLPSLFPLASLSRSTCQTSHVRENSIFMHIIFFHHFLHLHKNIQIHLSLTPISLLLLLCPTSHLVHINLTRLISRVCCLVLIQLGKKTRKRKHIKRIQFYFTFFECSFHANNSRTLNTSSNDKTTPPSPLDAAGQYDHASNNDIQHQDWTIHAARDSRRGLVWQSKTYGLARH